jgi:hypothetical protein
VRCCDHDIIQFTNVSVMNIAYSVGMRARFGNVPHVRVFQKVLGQDNYVEPLISVRLDGNPTSNINIDNGGLASGFVKIFK